MPEYYDDLIETAIAPINSTAKNKNANVVNKFFKSGRKIVYGDTGIKTNHYVGTKDEYLYFKVRLNAGETGREGATLFYDSPRDYCVHYLTTFHKHKNKFTKNDNYAFIQDRVDAMLSEMSPIIEEWRTRRDNYITFQTNADT